MRTRIALILAIGSIALNSTEGAAAKPRVYWGALVDGQVPAAAAFRPGGAFATFERQAGRRMSLVHWGQPWTANGRYYSFPRAEMRAVRRHGSIPVLNWASWNLGAGAVQPHFRMKDIVAGTFDGYIATWARQAKAWGHPFMLRFNHEMNGWWYPWGVGLDAGGRPVNGNTPRDFVRAWRHVHRIFDRVGARNVTWVWTPNIQSDSPRYLRLSRMYPGRRYVDWVGLSGYNRGDDWLSAMSLFTGRGTTYLENTYRQLRRIAPRKPVMLAETGSVEAGDGGARKAAWIRKLLRRTVPKRLKAVKAVMWFDWAIAPWTTMPIASSTAARAAFARSIASPRYAGNRYRRLSRSPIPPPGRLRR